MNNTKPYTKYKPSGIAWLGDIPEHWDVNKVKHIFTVQRGRVIANTDLIDNGLYPVYSSQTKNNGKLGCINTYDYDGEYISWTTDGVYAGTTFVRKGKFNATNICGLLKLKIDYQIEYFGYLFGHIIPYNKRPDTNGAKIMSNEMKDISFVIPIKPEQTAIAKFLDYKTAKIDRFIRKKKQLIKLLNEQKAGIINDAVTKGVNPNTKTKPSGIEWLGDIPAHWEVRKLKYVAEIVRGASPRPAGDSKYYGGSMPWVTVGELTKDKSPYLTETSNFLTEDGIKESRLIKKGTLAITNSGATLGVPKIFCVDGCINDGVVAFQKIDDHNFNKLYIYYTLDSFTQRLRTEMNQGSTQPNLNTSILGNITIPFIPKMEQDLIVSHIEKETAIINKTIATIEKEIVLVQEYRTAIIAEAVTGKIDVREYCLNQDFSRLEDEQDLDVIDENEEEINIEIDEVGGN